MDCLEAKYMNQLSSQQIERKIYEIGGHRVMLDVDLAHHMPLRQNLSIGPLSVTVIVFLLIFPSNSLNLNGNL